MTASQVLPEHFKSIHFKPTHFKPLHFKKARSITLLMAAAFPFSIGSAYATNFTLSADSTTAQTLGSGSGQTGTVNAGKTLTVSGSTVAVTISGNNATLSNLGTINQTGSGRVIRDNTGVTGLVINNGSSTNSAALMQAADADVIQMNKSPASVTLNNYGAMISLNASAGGSQAVDFNAILSGANTVNNYAGGLLKATEADAVRTGVNGVVNNAGTILSVTTTGSSSDGVDVQNNSGAQITNSGTIEGGRHGITGGAIDNTVNFTTSITNNLGGVIRGDNGSGINLDGFNAKQTVTVVNNGSIIGNGVTGDGDGVDVDGVANITNTGLIRSINAYNAPASGVAYSEGITVGGGTITNSGTIEGLVAPGNTNAVGRGISLAGVDITSGALAGTREGIYANTTVTNQSGGTIRGGSDSAIAVDGARSGFTVTINNNAGATVQGGGTANAAIRTGLDDDTINNAGAIDGSSSGKAIDMGAGNNTLNISGGAASVNGGINGGVGGHNKMTMDLGVGNNFAYAGSIANFDSVELKSGNATLSGTSVYSGSTIISGGILMLDGRNLISANSALALKGGELRLVNAGGANGETFASLSVQGSSSIDLGSSSITFNGLGAIDSGSALTVLGYSSATSPDYAFRFLGNDITNVAFLALMDHTTINGLTTTYSFDGTYTNVKVAPVPLPATFTMMLSGLGLLGAMRRRANAK